MHRNRNGKTASLHLEHDLKGLWRGDDIKGAHVAIIGAGPAGLSAAVQLSKESVPFRIFEGNRPGGLIWYANRVDNLLGHMGKTGEVLVRDILAHAGEMGIRPEMKTIRNLRKEDDVFILSTDDDETSFFDVVIIATGSKPERLNLSNIVYRIEREEDLRGKNLLIVGGGDFALDNALRAVGAGAVVTILHRSVLKANNSLVQEVEKYGIELVRGQPEDLVCRDGRYSIGSGPPFDMTAAFIGRSPNRDLLVNLRGVDHDELSHASSVKGLYLIGDAASVEHSQMAFAMSTGIACAMDIARQVRSDEVGDGERNG